MGVGVAAARIASRKKTPPRKVRCWLECWLERESEFPADGFHLYGVRGSLNYFRPRPMLQVSSSLEITLRFTSTGSLHGTACLRDAYAILD